MWSGNMAWNYTNTPGTANATERRDAVRALCGDTVSTNPLQTDEQIAFYLAQSASNVYGAAALACDAIAAWFAAQKADSLKIGQTSVDYGSKAEQYRAMAAQYRAMRTARSGGIFFGGVNVADNLSYAQDSSIVQPPTFQGQDSYPGTSPPLGTEQQEGR